MKNNFTVALFIVFLNTFSIAQISGSLQSSYQLGNLPDEKPADRTNLYNQLNLQYYQKNITIGLRIENYIADGEYEYNNLSQKYLQYQNNGFQFEIGNIYEILGRGILLRGYEIPGTIYEHLGTRQRYGFYKDIEGLSINYSGESIQTKMIYGRVLNNLLPPLLDETDKRLRRPVLVQGGELNYTAISQVQPGLILMRTDQNGMVNKYGGLNFQGYTENGFQYYAEYTQNINPEYSSVQLGKNGPYGLYGSISYSNELISSILEVKDYNNYDLGINDPPPLVREHSFTLLNRSIHSVEATGEKGFQFETVVDIGNFDNITFNHAQASINYADRKYQFYEYYMDLNYYLDENWLTKVFIDFAKDEFEKEDNRITTGISSQDIISGYWSYNSELQYQQFDRILIPEQKVSSILYQGTISHAPDFSISLLLEWVDDPTEQNYDNETELAVIFKDYLKADFYGLDISYIYSQTNTFSLFYGERRGGNACNGGICYQVQPFNGLEFRINSSF